MKIYFKFHRYIPRKKFDEERITCMQTLVQSLASTIAEKVASEIMPEAVGPNMVYDAKITLEIETKKE